MVFHVIGFNGSQFSAENGIREGRQNFGKDNNGIAFKPVPTMVVKADYQIYGDHRSAGETPLDNDKFQVTLGFVF